MEEADNKKKKRIVKKGNDNTSKETKNVCRGGPSWAFYCVNRFLPGLLPLFLPVG